MRFWLLFLLFPLSIWATETVIESNDMRYDGNTIKLIGEVILENAMGRVEAERATLTRDESGSTRIDFPWVELTRNVIVTLPDGGRLFCESVFLDHTQMTGTFEGIPQVVFNGEIGEVFADHALVEYNEEFKATKVILSDNVQLINQEKEQYALADFVTYYPQTQQMLLEGKGNRVLFYDKLRNMQLSAPSVRAKRDPKTQRDSVQGVGDVNFVFGQEELMKLKERFKW